MPSTTRPQAILLLGPTGAGKTPLGNYLQTHGLWGRRCLHIDFGALLRAAALTPFPALTEQEVEHIREVIDEGALLEDDAFGIARKILAHSFEEDAAGADDLIVLNGLPRHTGQADALADDLRIIALIVLECDAKTVWHRLCTNVGGDRAGRIDDSRELVARKFADYQRRTRLLRQYYHKQRVASFSVDVDPMTKAEEVAEQLPTTPPYALR